MKKSSPRLFRLKHALLCNPAVGPSLIQHWAKEGYLLHEKERQGSVERLTFSFSELVWVSLLVRLSWFGAISRDTLVKHHKLDYPRRVVQNLGTLEKYHLTDEFAAYVEDPTVYKLVGPKPILAFLENCNWNTLLTIEAIEAELEAPTHRSKKVGIRYGVRLWELEPGQTVIHVLRSSTFTDAMVFMDAQRIHEDVQTALGIS